MLRLAKYEALKPLRSKTDAIRPSRHREPSDCSYDDQQNCGTHEDHGSDCRGFIHADLKVSQNKMHLPAKTPLPNPLQQPCPSLHVP